MKIKALLLIALLALTAPLLAQQPPEPGTTPVDADAARKREEVMRELLRRAIANTNPPSAPAAPARDVVPMGAQPPAAARNLSPPAPSAPLPAPAVAPAAPTALQATPTVPSSIAPAPAVPPGPASTSAAAARASKAAEPIYQKDGLRLQGLEIDEFLEKIYSETVGRTIIRSPNLNLQTKISFRLANPLTKPEFIQLLDTVLAMGGVTMIPVGDKFVKAVPTTEALAAGAEFDKRKVFELPDSGQYITYVLQLTNVRPSEVQPAIQPFSKTQGGIVMIEAANVIVLRDNVENVKRMLEVVEKIDRFIPLDIESRVIPIKYALAGEIASVLGSLGGGGGGVTTTGGTTSGASRLGPGRGSTGRGGTGLGGAGTSGFGGVGGVGGVGATGVPGQPGYNPGVGGLGTVGGVGTTTGSFGAAGGTQSAFQQRLQQIVQRAAGPSGGIQILGEVKIIADERTNSLLVFASKADMHIVEKIIAQLDVVLSQVLIETIIMDVSLDDGWTFGVSAGQRPKTINGSALGGVANNANDPLGAGNSFLNNLVSQITTNISGGMTNFITNFIASATPNFPAANGFTYFGRIGMSYDLALQAIASDGRVNVIQRPRIQTSHATPASLFIGSTVPYVTSTYYGGGFGGGPSSSYQQLRVGIGLNVTPFINPDGLVVMRIDESIDEISGSTDITGVGAVPNTASRTLSAEIAVHDRETVILGGFIRNSERKDRSGIPLLKDIPLLGPLFSRRSSASERKELVVLMRPTVLPTPEAAATMTRYEQDNMPGVRAAERNALSDQYKRQREQGIDPDRPAPMFPRPEPIAPIIPAAPTEPPPIP